MCLSLPGRVVRLEGPMAMIDTAGVARRCNSLMYPDLKVGDRVLVHAGLVLEVLSEERAREMEETFAEMSVLAETDMSTAATE
jgi:hydrogenase expression/formation protein HypC